MRRVFFTTFYVEMSFVMLPPPSGHVCQDLGTSRRLTVWIPRENLRQSHVIMTTDIENEIQDVVKVNVNVKGIVETNLIDHATNSIVIILDVLYYVHVIYMYLKYYNYISVRS